MEEVGPKVEKGWKKGDRIAAMTHGGNQSQQEDGEKKPLSLWSLQGLYTNDKLRFFCGVLRSERRPRFEGQYIQRAS